MFKTKAKVLLMLVTCILLVFGMAACSSGGGSTDTTTPPSGGDTTTPPSGGDATTTDDAQAAYAVAGANIAFIIPADDKLAINDRGWIQETWTGVKNFATANGKTCTWYIPLDNSTQGYYDAITTAINSGSEVILALGSQPVEGVAQAAVDYPDTYFITVEGNGMEDYLQPNTYSLLHQSDEAGFLAGIAAVKAGFKNIGLVTGLDIPPMNIWTYGYLQGINYQAGLGNVTGIQVRHHYVNTSATSPDVQTLCASWYEDGVDLIIPMLAGATPSMFAAADAAQKPCFGADVDQGDMSDMVLTGAIKKLAETVPAALATVYNGTFPGDTYKWVGLDENAVGLATAHWRLDSYGYTVDDYQKDFNDLKNNVNGARAGILKESVVRTDPNSDAIDALWSAMPTHYVTFNNVY